MRRTLVIFMSLLITNCMQPQPAVVPSKQGANCQDACANLELLSCPEAMVVDGITCQRFCELAEASNGAIALDLDCVAGAETKAHVRQCNVDCGGGV
jgi:hypothetical protein